MPKAKKTSKKDTSSFIKKVASAGRRGDTELAYLSPKARDLLKKLGGSGTRNPRTDLKEFFLPGVPQLTPEQIAQLQQQFGQPAAPTPPVGSAAADMTAVSGPRGRTGGMPPATQPFQSIAPPAPTPPAPTAQAPRTAAQELEAFAARAAQQTAPQGGAASERAREDLTLTPGANRPGQNIFDADVTGCPPGHYFNPISQSCVPLPSNFDWRLGGSPADAARRAQEELDRRAQEEAARKAAEEEAARRAAEEAARKAAEEEAQRRAAEEAARLAAEEEARRRAEQDAQARRAAEEAARVAEEARRRQAEAEAARIAEEERRRREQEARAALPPPSPAPPSTPIPPGLVESPLPTPPPPAGTIPGDRGPRTHIFIDENRNGIDDRDEAPADTPRRGIRTPGSPPGGSDMRTGDFIDENLNGIDDRDEGKRESPGSGGFFDWTGAVDPNSDIGRLIARLRERGGKVGRGGPGGTPGAPPPPETGGGRPSPPPPPVFSPLPPREPGSIPLPDSGYVPTPIPTPGYIAAPLPQMPGAGTGTPFFNPNTGGLTPGTIPVSSDLPSLRTSDLPLQAIGQNPNLSPRVLGGEENLGYYTDRFGNIILSPGAVRPPGFAKGGSADADLLKELEEFREAEGLKDIDSARAMLERLSNEPATSSTEVSVSPLAQSVKRTSRTPIRQQTDRGTAKGMAMELEEVTQSRDQGPRATGSTKRQTEDLRQRMELLRNTLGMPTLSKATLAREGDLMARRFNEGGDVKKKQDETATAPGVRRTLPLQVRTYLGIGKRPKQAHGTD
jgi:chemotaxis protein histidine kinase CheA